MLVLRVRKRLTKGEQVEEGAMADDNVVPIEHQIPGRHRIEGTDLEISYNRQGDSLVLRLNKGGTQIFRVLLVDAAKEMSADDVVKYNPFSPDLVFKVGELIEGIQRAIEAADG
jgi:hypothetical protein